LIRTPILLYEEYPWPPIICLHYRTHWLASQEDFGFRADEMKCNY